MTLVWSLLRETEVVSTSWSRGTPSSTEFLPHETLSKNEFLEIVQPNVFVAYLWYKTHPCYMHTVLLMSSNHL
jgi:hypothetical protein